MDGNLYDFLIGAAPDNKQTQKAIAAQLRRRSSFGELGALTGDRVLQPFGQQLSKQADAYAGDLQDTRQKDIDNTQTKSFQDSQVAHQKEMERLTERGQTLDHIYQMLMAQAAQTKADKTGEKKPAKLTYSDRNKLEQMAGIIGNADELAGAFDENYAQRLGPGPQSRLPNLMSSIGASTEDMDKSANWWAGWNLIYSLPQRNATFGATLTPTERQAWTESDINPSMNPKTIKDRMSKVVNILKSKGALMNKTYSTQFDPEVIADYGLPNGDAPASPTPPPGTAVATPKRIRVDSQGNPIGN